MSDTYFLVNTAHIHIYCICGMEITGVGDSIKGCVGSVYLFGLHHDVSLCHHVVTGRITSKTRSKDDIIFIESCQLSRVSIYGKGKKLAYFHHKK